MSWGSGEKKSELGVKWFVLAVSGLCITGFREGSTRGCGYKGTDVNIYDWDSESSD